MKCMIFGSSGQLGRSLSKVFDESVLVSRSDDPHGIINDVRNYTEVEDLIIKQKPDVIINAAAISDVELCESDHKLAYSTNAIAVKHMISAASVVGSYFVQISTDYVFDGKDGTYREESVPSPINYYGISKLVGDSYALSYDNSIVIRTSGIFGYKNNFPLFAYNKLSKGERLSVMDAYYSPIHAAMLARSLYETVKTGKTGILNIAGERVSRVELSKRMCSLFGFDAANIDISDGKTMKFSAMRPKDSSLDISRAKSIISFDFYSLDSNLKLLNEDAA